MSLNSSGMTPTAASTAASAAPDVWLRRVLLTVAAFETLVGSLIDFGGLSPGPQCPTFHPPVPCDRGACARRALVSSCRDRRACSLYSRGVGYRMVT